jgi:diguanylate cyclase (GGDEF)-like protein
MTGPGGNVVEINASASERRHLRLSMACHQVPEVLVWAGALTLVFGLVNYLTLPDDLVWSAAINLVFGPVFLALAWAIRRGVVPAASVPWIWAMCSVALVVMLATLFTLQPSPSNLAYLVVVMTAFGPLTHEWPPFVVAGTLMVGACALAFSTTPGVAVVDATLVCVASILVSAVLLRLRIHALADLADVQAQLDHQAMYDPLTAALNRNGLERAVPGLVGAAQRSGEQLLVWFVDVRALKAANDTHGHEFGDEVIRATARALRACVRANDVLARWGGDEFVVIGSGHSGSAVDLNVRVDSHLFADQALVGSWLGTVTVGFSAGPSDTGVDALIRAADADMYRRREVPEAPRA